MAAVKMTVEVKKCPNKIHFWRSLSVEPCIYKQVAAVIALTLTYDYYR